MGLSTWLSAKEPATACNAGDVGSVSGSGRSPGKGNGNPLQYSCLRNPMDRGPYTMGPQRVRHDLATKPLPPYAICLSLTYFT